MTPQQIFAVALRVFAIWLALSSIQYLGPVEKSLERPAVYALWNPTHVYGIGAAMLLVALFLWFFPMLVAHRLLPHGRFEGRARPQLHETVRLGSALLSLWLWYLVLPRLQMKLTFLVAYGDPAEALLPHSAADKANLMVFGVELLLAFGLLFGGGLLARLVIREAKA